MTEFILSMTTDDAIGTGTCAERVLSALSAPLWMPERYGRHEPLPHTFDASDPQAFVQSWQEAGDVARNEASFHFGRRRKNRYDAAAIWNPHRRRLSALDFTFRTRVPGDFKVAPYLDVATSLFKAVNGQYAFVCTREEFWTKNVSDSWIGPAGRMEGGRARGTDLTQCLPGLYWANFFGPVYLDFFGSDRIDSSPAFSVRRGSDFRLLLSAATPLEWTAPETALRESQIREHLGSDAFFRLDQPTTRHTRAPDFEKRG